MSLDKDKPFSFVDEKVFVGNSLLGITDLRQLRAQHIYPTAASGIRPFEFDRAGNYTESLDVDSVLERVRNRRHALASEVDDGDPARSTTTKQRLQRENEEDLRLLERVADAVVATGLTPEVGAKPGTKLNEAYGDLAVALGRAFPPEGEGDEAMLEAILKRGLTPTVETTTSAGAASTGPWPFPRSWNAAASTRLSGIRLSWVGRSSPAPWARTFATGS